MKKKVVLLTGSMGRLGSALCEKFYDDYIFVGCSRSQKSNFCHRFIQADITEQYAEVVAEVLRWAGRIDVLINCAAVYHCEPLSVITQEQVSQTFQTNVITPHLLAVEALNQFWKKRPEKNKERNRSIINVSSISATNVYENQAIYSATKSALETLTLHQSKEFATFGIRVNALAPTSFPAILSSEEVADAVIALERSQETGIIKVLTKDDKQ